MSFGRRSEDVLVNPLDVAVLLHDSNFVRCPLLGFNGNSRREKEIIRDGFSTTTPRICGNLAATKNGLVAYIIIEMFPGINCKIWLPLPFSGKGGQRVLQPGRISTKCGKLPSLSPLCPWWADSCTRWKFSTVFIQHSTTPSVEKLKKERKTRKRTVNRIK